MSRLSLAVLVAAALVAGDAFGADAETCARSYEAAQNLRQESKPVAARRELLVCAQDACPAFVRRDCSQWLSDIEAEIPSVAIRVHGTDGCDRGDAEVTIDGKPAEKAADGRALELEPGSHSIRASVGSASSEQVVVVSPGERRRIVVFDVGSRAAVCGVSATLTLPPAAAPAPVVIGPTPFPSADVSPRKTPTLTWILGGIGAGVGAVSLGFGIAAWNEKGTLDVCKSHCAQHDVDVMKRNFNVADVTMFTAIASLGAAAYFYFTRR